MTTNQDILNAIRNDQTKEYQEKIPPATEKNGMDIYNRLEEYPSQKNDFIQTLTNKIGRSMFFNKAFNNPFKMLHKGLLPYGKSIEQIFVELAEQKGFDDHFEGSNTNEGDLIGITPPKVKVDYISQNFEYTFKTSISDLQLKGAFTHEKGLSQLLNKIVDSLYSQVQVAEFEDMKSILTSHDEKTTNGNTMKKGLIPRMYENPKTKANCFIPIGTTPNPKELLKKVKSHANKFTFLSTNYNLAGVKTFSDKKDLILYVTADMEADIDVEVLAFAFNVSNADIKVRTIISDDLGTTKKTAGQEVVAVLADSDFIQAYDTINTSNSFYVPNKLTTNMFAHKHGIMAGCEFGQAVIFVKGDSIA